MSRLGSLILVAALGALGSAACDNSQAIHEPNPSWARMIEQPRAEPYGTSQAFADDRAMRAPPKGTVPYGTSEDDTPQKITRPFLDRGRDRFDVFCAACHGVLGDGNSVVATKMDLRRPPSLYDERTLALSDEELVDIVATGYGLMPGYAVQITPIERHAVVAYLHALQLSQRAHVADLPAEIQSELQKEAP